MSIPPNPPHPADTSGNPHRQGTTDRSVPGGSFLLDQPATVPAVWGHGTSVAWPQGEPFYLAGGIGTGKTTLGAQVFLSRVGIGPGKVLGMPVTDDGGNALYLAMDRPSQIARALGRNVGPEHRDTLDRRVTFWRGPLPFYLPDHPEALLELAQRYDATTLIVDSVKDLAPGIEKPEIGWAVNDAFQRCVADGVQVGAWHHQKKSGADGKKPTTLADMYGSAWLGAGAGSVLLLWGDAGDIVVELTTLKPSMDQLGPWQVQHDHDTGTTVRLDAPDPLIMVRGAPKGVTVRSVAIALTGKDDPKPAQIQRARRDLERLVRDGKAVKADGDPANHTPALYLPVGGAL